MTISKIHPSRIGFDFDGVIADTAEAFIRIACHQHQYCDIRLDDITHFQVEKCTGMDREIVESIFHQILIDSIGAELLPMPGAIKVLEDMADIAQVKVITARSVAEPVHQWLQLHMGEKAKENICLVAMGDHDDKPKYVQQSNLTHFIDDRTETCMQLEQHGIRSILYSQPWNMHTANNLPKVASWDEIKALCF